MSGIYKIANKINGKFYIGQTERSLDVRWSEHKCNLNGNRHGNSHLQNAWNKYGEDAFEFSVILECPEETLNFWEKAFLGDRWKTEYKHCYNQKQGGSNGRLSEETKKKLSELNKGKNHPMWGKTHSEETKRKIGLGNKGKTISEEAKQKMRGPRPKIAGKNNHWARKVSITLADGEVLVFDTITDASKYFGLKSSTLSMRLKRGGQWGTDKRVQEKLKGAKIKYINN